MRTVTVIINCNVFEALGCMWKPHIKLVPYYSTTTTTTTTTLLPTCTYVLPVNNFQFSLCLLHSYFEWKSSILMLEARSTYIAALLLLGLISAASWYRYAMGYVV